MATPFFDRIKAISERGPRFHVPGHKGNPTAWPELGAALRYDITEVPGADNLANPQGPLAASETNMAALYHSGATLYSASGSTACIEAMLTLFVRPGQPVVMARNCHVAALRAAAFLDARPVWVLPQGGRPVPEDIAAALKTSGAKAVYVTSPDYYGRMADIPALRAVCDQYGAALLVDNAHGAHLRFLEPDTHPLTLGADATADSAHKTLPCLTPAAMLHLRDGALAAEARQALNLYASTSPSYLVLESLDIAADLLARKALDFASAAAFVADMARSVPHMVQPSDDPLRLTLRPAKGGWPAQLVAERLLSAAITPELADDTFVVLMASPYNPFNDYFQTITVLRTFPERTPLPSAETKFALPQPVCTVREAVFGKKRRVPAEEAAGHILASLDVPCPPGVPLVVPGERIGPEAAQRYAAAGISALDVLY